MTLYRRGSTYWFRFKWRGLIIRASAHTGSRTAALKAERARRNQLDEGASAIKTVKPLLFAKAAKDWLLLKEVHWSAATRRTEGYNVDHLLPHFGTSLLTDISADDVARYQAVRRREGASGRTVNMETGTLRAILRKHRLWAAIQPDVRPLAARTDVGRSLSKDEEARLLSSAKQSRSRSLYVAILLSIHTGLRNKELRMLRWRLVNLMEGFITVGVSKTRGGEGRVVPLSALALRVLSEWRANFPDAKPEHFVFPSREGWAPRPRWVFARPHGRVQRGSLEADGVVENCIRRCGSKRPASNAAGTISGTRAYRGQVKEEPQIRHCSRCTDGCRARCSRPTRTAA